MSHKGNDEIIDNIIDNLPEKGEMKIIRDEKCAGIMMIPLLHQWNITRCNFRGCRNRPNTIICNAHPKVSKFGLCEEHYQLGNKPGGARMDLVFDNSDLKDK